MRPSGPHRPWMLSYFDMKIWNQQLSITWALAAGSKRSVLFAIMYSALVIRLFTTSKYRRIPNGYPIRGGGRGEVLLRIHSLSGFAFQSELENDHNIGCSPFDISSDGRYIYFFLFKLIFFNANILVSDWYSSCSSSSTGMLSSIYLLFLRSPNATGILFGWHFFMDM